MYDPISVSTAVVSSNGDLLIELTDGNVINAGRVVGSPGPKGDRGEEGIRGSAGKDGIDGTNGAKWHTGVGAPDVGLGANGDLYMDVASSLLPIWQKVNNDWLFLANLKPTPASFGGGEGAAGGGGSVIIHPGPQPPIVDNDDRPIQEGDLWVDINGNHLYVYYNGVWSEVTTCSVGGGSSNGDFLKRYGDVVDDALEPVTYQWNEPVTIETKLKSNREGIKLKSPDSYINVGTIDGDEGQIDLYAADVLDLYGSQAKLRGSNVDVNASFGDVTQTAKNDIVLTATDGAERINRTIDDTNIDDQIVNKRYVDTKAEFTQREVEVLQEEIEAITPTTDKGIWQDGASATPGTGHFAMRRQGGAITQSYLDTDIDTIIVSTTKDGSGHSFLTEEVGDLIQLFDVEDKNYGLFEIEAIDTATTTEYVSFTVKWLQGIGETNVDDDVLIKTFAPPTGGTASEFLPLAGGVMIGEVQWNKTDSASFSGINLVTSISDPNVPDDANGRVFYANMGASYQPPRVLCGVPPTEPQSVVNKKYVDNLFDFSQYDELT